MQQQVTQVPNTPAQVIQVPATPGPSAAGNVQAPQKTKVHKNSCRRN